MTRSSLMLALVIMASVLITSGQQSTEEAGKGLKPGTHMGKMYYVIVPHVLQPFDPVQLKPSLDFIFFGNGDRIKIVLTLSKNTFNTTKPTYVRPQERVIIIDNSGYARVSITCTFNNTCVEMLKDQLVWSFRFVSDHPFGMYVHFLVSDLSAATLTPVPVESWGKKYFVVTLGSQHYIGILAGEVGVNVTLTFNFERDYEGIVHDGYTYRLNNELNVFVQKSEGYIISTCGKSDYIGHISGTSIEGKEPFGVVSGSCSSGTMATPCSGPGKESVGRKDMAAVCKDREWGLGCKFKCSNCETDCDKFTGVCERCLPGYQDTNNSCNRPCNVYTYGQDCSQDCKFKCDGDDCLERVFGTCPSQGAIQLLDMNVRASLKPNRCHQVAKENDGYQTEDGDAVQ
uniref:IgGFc-binding protein N-terminal domain-containing protein n=1 Tax=Biomphalaria glabrata TaxID=6526 RepID=A0A2C9KK44_BIOGL